MTPTELEDAISRLETAGPHISITLGEVTGIVRISDLLALLSTFREQREALERIKLVIRKWRVVGLQEDKAYLREIHDALHPEGEG